MYEGEAKTVFSATASYKAIEKPHNAIHQYAKSNLEYIHPQDTVVKNKAKVFENLVKMEEASDKMFELMDQMLDESQKK